MQKNKCFYLLSPKNLAMEVSRYGYTFSVKGFWKKYVLAIAGLIIVGFIYQLQLFYMMIVFLFVMLLSPFIILNMYRNAYEQKRFLDVTNYLEQILYSFKRIPKIMISLEDTLVVFPDGRMHDLISKTLEHIQTKELEGDIYQDAFVELENEYGCRRLKQVHTFLIKVEQLGGEFDDALNTLLEDRQLWVSRVYEMAQERKVVERNILISIVLSSLICKLAAIMLPSDLVNLKHPLSQIVTTIFLILSLFIWYIGQRKLNSDWLAEEDCNGAEIKKNYERICHKRSISTIKKFILKSLFLIPLCMFSIIFKNTALLIAAFTAAILIVLQPMLITKTAKKRMVREINKAFPAWLMEMSLLLQTENVHNALAKSIDHSPGILKEDLEKMLLEIEQKPNHMKPYLNFMPEFDLPDIQSALRMLYSLSSFGDAKDAKDQIGVLVQRNNKLLDQAERLKNEDALAGAGVLILIPMLTGSIKMMIDMGILLFNLLNTAQGLL